MHPRSTRKDRFRIFRCCGDLRTHQITYRLAALRALLFVFLFTTGVLTNSSVDIVLHDTIHTATPLPLSCFQFLYIGVKLHIFLIKFSTGIALSVSSYYYYYYRRLLSQAFSSWCFSWTSSDPHRSGFKLHTAVLSVLCVMFQVQLSFVVNLSSFSRYSFQIFP